MFVGPDLTPNEQLRKGEILKILKQYWQCEKIPQSQFIRDNIKVYMDGD